MNQNLDRMVLPPNVKKDIKKYVSKTAVYGFILILILALWDIPFSFFVLKDSILDLAPRILAYVSLLILMWQALGMRKILLAINNAEWPADLMVGTVPVVPLACEKSEVNLQFHAMGRSIRKISIILLIQTLVFIAVGGAFVTGFVKQKTETAGKSGMEIIVAANDLEKGAILTKENVAYDVLKKNEVPNHAILISDARVVLGHRLVNSLKRADPIVWDKTDVVLGSAVVSSNELTGGIGVTQKAPIKISGK